MYLTKHYQGFERSLLIKHWFYFVAGHAFDQVFTGYNIIDPGNHELHQNQKILHGKLIQVNPRLSVRKRKRSSLLLNPPNNKDEN